MPSECKSLLDMGFTLESSREAANLSNDEVAENEESTAGPSSITSRMLRLCETMAALIEELRPRRQATTSTTLDANVETGTLQ